MGRAVDTAADALRENVLAGTWSPGDRLPPERELAGDVGVSRLTLRAALARLEGEGLVVARQGSGITVQDYRESSGVELLVHLLERGDLELLKPMLQLRRAVAVEAAASACVLATDAELDALQAHAEALAAETDLDALAEGNLAFGRDVLRLARNLPMELLFNTVAQIYRARPELSRAMLADAPLVRASFPLIVDLLRTRDPDHVRPTVRAALEAVDAATLAKLEVP